MKRSRSSSSGNDGTADVIEPVLKRPRSSGHAHSPTPGGLLSKLPADLACCALQFLRLRDVEVLLCCHRNLSQLIKQIFIPSRLTSFAFPGCEQCWGAAALAVSTCKRLQHIDLHGCTCGATKLRVVHLVERCAATLVTLSLRWYDVSACFVGGLRAVTTEEPTARFPVLERLTLDFSGSCYPQDGWEDSLTLQALQLLETSPLCAPRIRELTLRQIPEDWFVSWFSAPGTRRWSLRALTVEVDDSTTAVSPMMWQTYCALMALIQRCSSYLECLRLEWSPALRSFHDDTPLERQPAVAGKTNRPTGVLDALVSHFPTLTALTVHGNVMAVMITVALMHQQVSFPALRTCTVSKVVSAQHSWSFYGEETTSSILAALRCALAEKASTHLHIVHVRGCEDSSVSTMDELEAWLRAFPQLRSLDFRPRRSTVNVSAFAVYEKRQGRVLEHKSLRTLRLTWLGPLTFSGMRLPALHKLAVLPGGDPERGGGGHFTASHASLRYLMRCSPGLKHLTLSRFSCRQMSDLLSVAYDLKWASTCSDDDVDDVSELHRPSTSSIVLGNLERVDWFRSATGGRRRRDNGDVVALRRTHRAQQHAVHLEPVLVERTVLPEHPDWSALRELFQQCAPSLKVARVQCSTGRVVAFKTVR